MLKYLWLSAGVVVLDQFTKHLAVKHLLNRPPLEILPVFDLQLVYNTGAAFGLLDDAGGWQNAFFVAVAVVVGAFIFNMLRRLKAGEVQGAVSLALILGGAVGNVIDRLQHGYVVDFIHWYYRSWHWPTFNIADAAITVGAVLLVLDTVGWRILGRREGDGA